MIKIYTAFIALCENYWPCGIPGKAQTWAAKEMTWNRLGIWWCSSLAVLMRAFLVAQLVKNPPAMQETRVWSLGQEGPLEKEMATHSSILAWKIPWTEEPRGLQCMKSPSRWARLLKQWLFSGPLSLIAKVDWPWSPGIKIVSLAITSGCRSSGSEGMYTINLSNNIRWFWMAVPIYTCPLAAVMNGPHNSSISIHWVADWVLPYCDERAWAQGRNILVRSPAHLSSC